MSVQKSESCLHKGISRLAAIIVLLTTLPVLAGTGSPVSGMVLNVDSSRRTVLVSCKTAPKHMQTRVISVSVSAQEDLSRLQAGAMVDFTLLEDRGGYRAQSFSPHQFQSVEQDPFTAHHLRGLQSAVSGMSHEALVVIGQLVPDFRLIDQSEGSITLSQFAGKVIAVNFAYTRCALPQFCYRLTNNLATLQKRFSKQVGRDLVLLTISFDPVHDQPVTLAEAAKMWNADPHGWHFLTGPPEEIQRVCGRFGVDAWADEGLMIHSLHTLVIDSRQHLVANLEGNEFSAEQLGDLVEEVLNQAQRSNK
jgi:protein SCO1